MTDREWKVIERTLRAGWVADDLDVAAYRGLLGDYSVDVVLKALRSLMVRGAKYVRVPKVAEIVAAIEGAVPRKPPGMTRWESLPDETRAELERLTRDWTPRRKEAPA